MDASPKSKSSTLPGRYQQRPVAASNNGGFLGKLKRRFRLKSKNYEFDTDTDANVQCIYFKRTDDELKSNTNTRDIYGNKIDKRSTDLFRSVSERSPVKPPLLKNKFENRIKNSVSKKIGKHDVKDNLKHKKQQNSDHDVFDFQEPCVRNDFLVSSDSGVIDLDSEGHCQSHDDVFDDLELDPGYETLDEIRKKLQIKNTPKTVQADVTIATTDNVNSDHVEYRPTHHRRCQSSGTSDKFLSCMTGFDPRRDSGLGSPNVSDSTNSQRTSSCLTRDSTTSDTDLFGCHGNGYSDLNELTSNLLALRINSCPIRQDVEEESNFVSENTFQNSNHSNQQFICNSDTCLAQNNFKNDDPVSELYANPKILLKKKSQKEKEKKKSKENVDSSCNHLEVDTAISGNLQQSLVAQGNISSSQNDLEAEPPPIPERKYSLDNELCDENSTEIFSQSEIRTPVYESNMSSFDTEHNDQQKSHFDGGTELVCEGNILPMNVETIDNHLSDQFEVTESENYAFNQSDFVENSSQSYCAMNLESSETTFSQSSDSETKLFSDEFEKSGSISETELVNSETGASFESITNCSISEHNPKMEISQASSPTECESIVNENTHSVLNLQEENKKIIVPTSCKVGVNYGGLQFGWDVEKKIESEKIQNSSLLVSNESGISLDSSNDSSLDMSKTNVMTDSQTSYEEDADAILENLFIDESAFNSSCDQELYEHTNTASRHNNLHSDMEDENVANSEPDSNQLENFPEEKSSDDKCDENGKMPEKVFSRLPDYYYHDNEPIHMSLSEIWVTPPKIDSDKCRSSCNDINLEELRRQRPSMNKRRSGGPSFTSSHHQNSAVSSIQSSHEIQNVDLEFPGHFEDTNDLDDRPPAIVPRASKESQCQQDFMESMRQLKDCGWYWGPLSWDEAEIKLTNKPDGSFLVRDSSDDRYILSLSFNIQGRVHHTRIEHHKGKFSFWSQPDSHGQSTIKDFIEQCVKNSKNGQFLYFIRPSAPGSPPMPVHLLHPISRFKQMRSLQHTCRFKILQTVRRDHIDLLPIPTRIKNYLNEAQYYVECLDD